MSAKLCFECGRCLESVEHELSINLHESIEHATLDDTIDISLLVDENIILNIPQKILCAEDCKGLCTVCGTNRNNRECACKHETDPRLDALKGLPE